MADEDETETETDVVENQGDDGASGDEPEEKDEDEILVSLKSGQSHRLVYQGGVQAAMDDLFGPKVPTKSPGGILLTEERIWFRGETGAFRVADIEGICLEIEDAPLFGEEDDPDGGERLPQTSLNKPRKVSGGPLRILDAG